MRVRYVTLQWDQRPREFEQTKLDIAWFWLAWSNLVGENREDRTIQTVTAVYHKLIEHPEFMNDHTSARRYAIAAIRCGYNPATTPISGIRETRMEMYFPKECT